MAHIALRSRAAVAGRIGLVYLLARAVTTTMLLIAAELSGPTSRYGADATLGVLSMAWDGQWYWLIAEEGYPSELPRGEDGTVAENAWAFMPVYPFVARGIGFLLGAYPPAAVLLSVLAGYAASVLLYALLVRRIGAAPALWAVAFFANGPLAALFQMGYAEPLFLVWLFLALLLLTRRRYGWLYPVLLVMAYTRPGVLAFALLLGLHGIHRWATRRRDPLPPREIVHIVALGAWATILGFSWQVFAAVATGDPAAYLDTELAWRRAWVGAEETFIPFAGTIQAAAMWFSLWFPAWSAAGTGGVVALLLLVAGLGALLIRSRSVRALGPEIRLWSAGYLIYLLAVFFPQSSTFRLLLPLSPLAGALALPPSRAWRIGVLVACLAGQWWWIHEMLALGNTYVRIP